MQRLLLGKELGRGGRLRCPVGRGIADTNRWSTQIVDIYVRTGPSRSKFVQYFTRSLSKNNKFRCRSFNIIQYLQQTVYMAGYSWYNAKYYDLLNIIWIWHRDVSCIYGTMLITLLIWRIILPFTATFICLQRIRRSKTTFIKRYRSSFHSELVYRSVVWIILRRKGI